MVFIAAALCSYILKSDYQNSEYQSRPIYPSIAQARGVIGRMAARELSIPGSEVARRFKQDRSAVSRAAQRVENNEELMKAATAIMEQLRGETKQS